MKQWTIAKRLGCAFLLVAGITATLGVFSFKAATDNVAVMRSVTQDHMPAVEYVLTIKDAISGIAGAQQALLNPTLDVAGRKGQYDLVTAARERYKVAWDAYEAIPQEEEAAALWKKVTAAIAVWREANNEFFKVCQDFDALGITNPGLLLRQLEKFKNDHQCAMKNTLQMVVTKEPFDGGEDHTACAFGKWLSAFKPVNAQLDACAREITEKHQAFHAGVAAAKQLARSGDTGAMDAYRQRVVPAAEQVFAVFDRMTAEAVKAEDLGSQAAALSRDKVIPLRVEGENLLTEVVDFNRKEAQAEAAAAVKEGLLQETLAIVLLAAGVLVSVLLGVLITRGINRVLNRIVTGLNEGADQVHAAAGQVSSASQQLAEGASEQASSLEETSSALEQMAAMTRANAANAKQANELAVQARQAANQGDHTMGRLNGAMADINESSGKISKIIKVIEEIAFQTNLLALNAAVEAARAGEHGKGFAVVADEVRNLAQRAAQAARETTSLIEGAVNNAREGTQVAGEVGKVLGTIVQDATKVSDLIDGISKASEEQAQGVDQVNSAVSQMDKVTQANAAGAEESASAAEELAAQAQSVKAMVNELVALVRGVSAAGHGTTPVQPARAGAASSKTGRPPARVTAAKAQAGEARKEEFLDLGDEKLSSF